MAIGVILEIWGSGSLEINLSRAQRLLIIAKISRVILVPGQASSLKPFLDWLLIDKTNKGTWRS